jgi:hypothetical protein
MTPQDGFSHAMPVVKISKFTVCLFYPWKDGLALLKSQLSGNVKLVLKTFYFTAGLH